MNLKFPNLKMALKTDERKLADGRVFSRISTQFFDNTSQIHG